MADFELSWDAPEDVVADEYIVRKRYPDSANVDWLDVEGGSTRSTSLIVRELFGRERVQFGIAPVVDGREFEQDHWEILCVRPDDTTDFDAPSSVAGFVCNQVGPHIVARWTEPTDPFLERIEIRFGSSWENGIVLATASPQERIAMFGWWGAGATTFYAKWFTVHGLESASASSSSVTTVADGEWPAQGTHDEHGGGYGGTKTGTEVDSSNLQLTDYPGVADDWTDTADSYTGMVFGQNSGSGTYVTAAQDAGATVEEAVEVSLTVAVSKPSLAADDYNAPVMPRPETDPDPDAEGAYQYVFADGTLRDGLDVTIDIDTTPDSGGSPTWDGFRRWVPGAVYTYRQVRLRLNLTMPFPLYNFTVSAFTWKRRRKNYKDEGTVSVSGTGGTAITFAAPFTEAPQVVAVADSTSALVVTVDSITTSGADLYVFNSSGTEQSSGTLRWVAAGV